jgi:spore coat protein U-like protein
MRRAVVATLLMWLMAPCAARAACSISNATINFGFYTGALVQIGAGIPLTCDLGTAYTLGMNSGLHSGGTNYNWNMIGPNSTLMPYQVFRDATRLLDWGTTTLDDDGGVGLGTAKMIPAYPQIPANGPSTPGTYTDTITVFLNTLAGTTTATLTVTAVIQAFCSISLSAMAFGTYAGVQTDASATASVTCTNTTTYWVAVNDGQNSSTTYLWNMIGPGSALLTYKLYQDAARTQLWGATHNLDAPNGTGTGAAQSIPVYGRIAAGQYVTPGSYTDIVTFTLNY